MILLAYIYSQNVCIKYEGNSQSNPIIVIEKPQAIEFAYLAYKINYKNIDTGNFQLKYIYTSVPAEQSRIEVTVYGQILEICSSEADNIKLLSSVSQVTNLSNFNNLEILSDNIVFIDLNYRACYFGQLFINIASNSHGQLLDLYQGKPQDWSTFTFKEYTCEKRIFIDIKPETGVISVTQNDVIFPVYNPNLSLYNKDYGNYLYPEIRVQNQTHAWLIQAPCNPLKKGDQVMLSESILFGEHSEYIQTQNIVQILAGVPIEGQRPDGFENISILNKCVQFYANSPRDIEYPLGSGIIFNIRTEIQQQQEEGYYSYFYGPYICVDNFTYMPAMFYTWEDPALKHIFTNLTNINDSFEEMVINKTWPYLTNDVEADKQAIGYTRSILQAIQDMCLKAYFSDNFLINLSKCLIFIFCPLIGINIVMKIVIKEKSKGQALDYILSILAFVALVVILLFTDFSIKVQFSSVIGIGLLYIFVRGLCYYQIVESLNDDSEQNNNSSEPIIEASKQQIQQKRITFWIQYIVQALIKILDIIQTVTDIMQILQYLQIQFYSTRVSNLFYLIYPSEKMLYAAEYLAESTAYPIILLGFSLINQEIMKQEWFKQCIKPSADPLDNKTFLIKMLPQPTQKNNTKQKTKTKTPKPNPNNKKTTNPTPTQKQTPKTNHKKKHQQTNQTKTNTKPPTKQKKPNKNKTHPPKPKPNNNTNTQNTKHQKTTTHTPPHNNNHNKNPNNTHKQTQHQHTTKQTTKQTKQNHNNTNHNTQNNQNHTNTQPKPPNQTKKKQNTNNNKPTTHTTTPNPPQKKKKNPKKKTQKQNNQNKTKTNHTTVIQVFGYFQGFVYNVFFAFTDTKLNFDFIKNEQVKYNVQVIVKIYLSGTIYSISKFQLILEYYQQINKAIIKIFVHLVQMLTNLLLIISSSINSIKYIIQCNNQAVKIQMKIMIISILKLIYYTIMLVVDPIVTVFLPTSLMFQELTKLCPFLLQVFGICDHQDEFAKQTGILLTTNIDQFFQSILSSIEVYGICIFFGLLFSKNQTISIAPLDQWQAIFFGIVAFITPYICKNSFGSYIMKQLVNITHHEQISDNIVTNAQTEEIVEADIEQLSVESLPIQQHDSLFEPKIDFNTKEIEQPQQLQATKIESPTNCYKILPFSLQYKTIELQNELTEAQCQYHKSLLNVRGDYKHEASYYEDFLNGLIFTGYGVIPGFGIILATVAKYMNNNGFASDGECITQKSRKEVKRHIWNVINDLCLLVFIILGIWSALCSDIKPFYLTIIGLFIFIFYYQLLDEQLEEAYQHNADYYLDSCKKKNKEQRANKMEKKTLAIGRSFEDNKK
ncbi:extensin-like [Hexamita inflata]|uniref:Extensin-like n=1 Tax=Hexamita inflata TaxID=28002 RepID=A0AA86UIG5_9EUKA|nr:extensin-like [Hexamita inflata]